MINTDSKEFMKMVGNIKNNNNKINKTKLMELRFIIFI